MLPRGVWFERSRKRYRVRVYKGTRPYYRKYHKVLDEAIADLQRVLSELDMVQGATPLHTVDDQVAALRLQFIAE